MILRQNMAINYEARWATADVRCDLDVIAETTDDYAGDRVVDLVIALHAATPLVEQLAGVDDFALPGRWSVQHQLDADHTALPTGPYAASSRSHAGTQTRSRRLSQPNQSFSNSPARDNPIHFTARRCVTSSRSIYPCPSDH